MKVILLSILCIFAVSYGLNAQTSKACRVIKVSDGDSIRVDCSGVSDRIRLCGIDSPEKKQPYSKEATALVKQLLKGGSVELVEVERDRFERMVAEVYVGNIFVNAEVVKAGYAYEYKKYSKKCPRKIEITQAESQAQRNKVGVWDGGSYQFPWDFRRK